MPAVGESIIVLDFVEEKLRNMTVNLRVIKADAAPLGTEEGRKVNEAELAQKPIFETPAKQYPTGTMVIKQSFTEKGYFIGYIIVEDDSERLISRFPLSVGYPKLNALGIFSSPAMVVGAFFLIVIPVLHFSRRRELLKAKENKS